MLRHMRTTASSWLIKILLGIIVLAFVFMGVGSYRAKRAGQVAIVNGQPIQLTEYQDRYKNLVDQYKKQFGGNIDDKMIKMLNLKSQAINQLVDQAILVQEAKKLNFRVTNDELAAAITKMQAFRNGNVFSENRYKRLLRNIRMTPGQFEQRQREFMLTSKLRKFVSFNAKVSEQEAKSWYQWKNLEVKINAVLFSPDDYKGFDSSRADIEKYFNSHKESYKTEPKIKVKYLCFKPDDFKAKVKVTDDEIKDYYDNNQDKFYKEKTVEARHILIKVDGNADPASVKAAKERADKIAKMANEKNADFAALAKKYSEGPSKDRGGYLGTFKRKNMVKAFADKAFSMKQGEISEPVRTRFGFHIIKVEKVNKAKTIPFEAARADIKNTLADIKAKSMAYNSADDGFEAALDDDDLSVTAKKMEYKLFTTDFFTKNGPKGDIDEKVKFASVAFALPQSEISDVLDLKNGYYILQVIKKIPVKLDKLINVEKRVKNDLIGKKQDKKAHDESTAFLKALKNENVSLKEKAAIMKLKVISTGFFKRSSQIPNLGFEQGVNKEAFILSSKKKLPDSVIKGKKGYYVIEFEDRHSPDSKGFENKKKEITDNLLQQKRSSIFTTWLKELRDRSKIKIQQDML